MKLHSTLVDFVDHRFARRMGARNVYYLVAVVRMTMKAYYIADDRTEDGFHRLTRFTDMFL